MIVVPNLQLVLGLSLENVKELDINNSKLMAKHLLKFEIESFVEFDEKDSSLDGMIEDAKRNLTSVAWPRRTKHFIKKAKFVSSKEIKKKLIYTVRVDDPYEGACWFISFKTNSEKEAEEKALKRVKKDKHYFNPQDIKFWTSAHIQEEPFDGELNKLEWFER